MKKIAVIFICLGLIFVSCSKKAAEKPAQTALVNPFFEDWNTPFGVPPFDLIKEEHYMPALISFDDALTLFHEF